MKQILPPLYQNFFTPPILDLALRETKATCDNCLRARDKRFAYAFDKNLKCCTFHPHLPNYAVGGLLISAPKSEGVRRVLEKIDTKTFALPIGVIAPFDYQLMYSLQDESDFGTRADLLCPYYNKQENQCSIWTFRGSSCTSYYCRSDYGQAGLKFWAIFSEYLSHVERVLALNCLRKLGVSEERIEEQLEMIHKREFEAEDQNKRTLSNSDDQRLWSGLGEKLAFYKSCYEISQKIRRVEFESLLEDKGLFLEEEVIEYSPVKTAGGLS